MSASSQRPPPTHEAIPPDHPVLQNFKQLQETFQVVERIAIVAVNKLGGTLRITDAEWGAAQGADMQWRTMRPTSLGVSGLEPEIHVAVTMQGEDIEVTGRDIANLKDEIGGRHDN